MSTVYLRQPVSAEPRMTTRSAEKVQMTPPGTSPALLTSLAKKLPMNLSTVLDWAPGNLLPAERVSVNVIVGKTGTLVNVSGAAGSALLLAVIV
jgi:hypothetical protein